MSMPRAVRHINEMRVLDTLYRRGAVSRADLARELGLTRATAGHLVLGLSEQGLIEPAPPDEAEAGGPGGAVGASRTGRPGQLLRLRAGHSAFIGADIGVGHLSVVVVDLLGEVVRSRTVPFSAATGDAPGEAPAAVDAIVPLLQEAMQALPAGQTVQALCVTVPGPVDRQGVVRRAPVLGWQSVPVTRLLAERLGWSGPISAENDANAFAAAELFGRDRSPHAEALFVYLDAGVGGGIASAGRLLRGQRGQAGEIGHIHLGERGFETNTAVQGSFESYVSRQAVLARWQQLGGVVGGSDPLNDYLAALQAQQPAALRTGANWAGWLGCGLASLISVLDPGRIVLGGPVAALFESVQPLVLASIRKHLVPPFELPTVEVSALGLDACAVGGAMLLHREHLTIDERLVYGVSGADPLPPGA